MSPIYVANPALESVCLTRFQVDLLEQLHTTHWRRQSELGGPRNAGHVSSALAALARKGFVAGAPASQVEVAVEGPPGEMCWWRV